MTLTQTELLNDSKKFKITSKNILEESWESLLFSDKDDFKNILNKSYSNIDAENVEDDVL